jgi:putative hydrolase of HD superfamily
MIDFLLRAYSLKDQPRTGWVMRNIQGPESVASHSWATAVLCLLFAQDAGVDTFRAVRIALIHDLAEAEIGDIAARANETDRDVSITEKARMEQAAIQSLLSDADEGELQRLWQEYEDATTSEALFVREMNLIDVCLQALKYEQEGRYDPNETNDHFTQFRNLDEFFVTTRQKLKTPLGKRLHSEIEAQYRQARQDTKNG